MDGYLYPDEMSITISIQAVAFDADGVIQSPLAGRRSSFREVLGPNGNLDEFLADIFEAEVPALEGRSNFKEALSGILSRWQCHGTLSDVLDAWTMIEVNAQVAATVRALRRAGISCYLATNQESNKAYHMSEVLGYRHLFDKEFYSCRIGAMKPDVAYFRGIMKEINIPPSHVLFLDDNQTNVESARQVGLHAAKFTLEAELDALHRILADFGIHFS
jgi:putative hydrolase of the HAD superfamily